MSVGLLIKEGQVGRKILPVEKLKINNIGGGESYWILEETTEVDSLDVSENGLYYAVNDDLDGYDQVNVNVPPDMDESDIAKGKKIIGTGDDGNDYAYGRDEDGNLDVEHIPAAIHIVVPPRKLKYEDGETIDFSGIHVYLMDGNNQRYTDEDYPTGEIPFGELIFPVTTAEGKSSGKIIHSDITDDFPVGALSSYNEWSVGGGAKRYTRNRSSASGCLVARNSYYDFIVSSGTIGSTCDIEYEYKYVSKDGEETPLSGDGDVRTYNLTTECTYNGKTAYYTSITIARPGTEEITPESIEINNNDFPKYAWAMVYGTDVSKDETNIPVQWMRPDGEILEDTFTIEIVADGEDTEDEEQSQQDPFVGYADISSNGHFYNINRKIVPQVHYANGYVWQEGLSTEYSVEQAASLGLIILLR